MKKYETKHWDWNAYTRVKEIITRVNKIRKEYAAFHTTYNIHFATTTNNQIICYCKQDKYDENNFIIAVNLDPHNTQSAHVNIPLEKLNLLPDSDYKVKDLLSGDIYQWHGSWNYVQLNPYEMPSHILKIEKN